MHLAIRLIFPALCALLLVPGVSMARNGPKHASGSLVRAAAAPDDDARGDVRVRSHKNDERMVVKAKRLDGSANVELFLENGAGQLVFIAEMKSGDDADDFASFRYRARIKKGKGMLPFGAEHVDALAGRMLEVRANGESVLTGFVPAIGTSPKLRLDAREELAATVDAPNGASAFVRMRSRPHKDDERFSVKVDDFPLGDSSLLRLYLEDPDDPGVLVEIGPFEPDSDDLDDTGHRFRRRNRKGDPLPFRVRSVVELENLAVEIRHADSGDVLFEGMTPSFD